MAQISNQSNNSSRNYGDAVVHQVNVLSSCYLVDSTGGLKGLHYCTTGVLGMFTAEPHRYLFPTLC